MWFKLRTSDSSFVDRSKKQFSYDFRVDAPAMDVFRWVTELEHIPRWMPDVRAATWLSAPPHGVASLREVRLRGISVQERILTWEPGERFSFTLIRATAPILKRMVEDYRFEAITPTATRVRWTIAYEPHPFAAAFERALAPRFARMFERAAHKLSSLGAPTYPQQSS